MSERRVAIWISLTFFGLNVYYFHRWVFKYNSSGTSPTYTDTPFAWQSAKYVILFVISVAAWGMVLWRLWSQTSQSSGSRVRSLFNQLLFRPTGGVAPILMALMFYMALLSLIATDPTSDRFGNLVVVYFFIPIVLLMPTATLGATSFSIYKVMGVALIAYHFVYTGIQLFFYFSDDRLPALAYARGLVRFGGGLDDPNGFGVMMILPILLGVSMWSSFRGRWRSVLLIAACSGLLFLTLSFTAIIGVVVGLLALAAITRRVRVLLGVFALVVVGGVVFLMSDYLQGVVRDKRKSALARFDFDSDGSSVGFSDFLDTLNVQRFLFGAPGDGFGTENGYIELMTSFGIVGVVTIIVVVFIALRRAISTARSAREGGHLGLARLYEGLGAYIVAFMVACLGVPFFSVFPSNMLFWLVVVMSAIRPELDSKDADSEVDGVLAQ